MSRQPRGFYDGLKKVAREFARGIWSGMSPSLGKTAGKLKGRRVLRRR